jgi:hypothetical protein
MGLGRRVVAAACAAVLGVLLAGAAAGPAAAEVVWLCKPGMADDPCRIGLDTTVREPGGAERVERPEAARDPGIDCFYVYPTVSNQLTPNADKSRDPELDSIAKYQAARFNQHCRVFAPIYRQSTLASIGTGYASASGADRQLAYGDVREAWLEYLERDNRGRGVVLIGHSQGTGMLRQLLRREIEPDPAQLRRVVSALLLGGNVHVKAGSLVGGDFRRTPLCTEPGQLRCVVAFSTFAEDPPANARFGRSSAPTEPNPSTLPGGPGFEVACTDPRPLAGTRAPLRLLLPSEPYAPGPIAAGTVITAGGAPPSAPTTWVVPPDRFEGGCTRIRGVHVLRYDPLPGSRRPVFFPEPTWGTHLVDVNLALEPLVDLVGRQAERWTRPELRLTRRCVGGGRLRVTLGGPEAELVREVAVKAGRRTLARDRSAPFTVTLRRADLRRARAGRASLRAVAGLDTGGRPVVLERALPGCGLR